MSKSRTYGRKSTKRKFDTGSEVESPKRQRLDLDSYDSPPKPARDLSQIFDAALSPSAPSTPTKLAKRMLGRSKTEPFLEDSQHPSKSLLDRTSSLPSFASPSKHTPSMHLSPSASLMESPSSPQRPAIANTRTYAGKSRSFLMPMPADQSELQDDFNNRESYATLRSRWGVDNSEDDPYPELSRPIKSNDTTPNSSPSKRKGKGRLKQEVPAPADIIQPLKSITEIRNKGENRRFLDEVGYLLEGMGKDETPALKKASALEIISRLCESEFVRQAKAADFLQSTWEAFIEAGAGNGKDKVFDTLLVTFLALVSRDFGSLTDIAQRGRFPSSSTSSQSSFASTIFFLLASLSPDTDPLFIISQSSVSDSQLKKIGIMKADRAVLKTLHSTITSEARIFASKTPISNALLVTRTLTVLPAELLSCICMSPLLKSLRSQLQSAVDCLSNLENDNHVSFSNGDIQPTKTHTDAVSSSSDLLTISFGVIHDLLALLDGYLLGQWAPSSAAEQEGCHRLFDEARDEWLAEGLVAVGITAELASLGGKGKRKFGLDSASRCTEIVFRVLVSLTHSDTHWGRALTQNDRVMMFIVRTIVRADDMRRSIMAQTRGSMPAEPTGKLSNGKQKIKRKDLVVAKDEETDNEETDRVSSEDEWDSNDNDDSVKLEKRNGHPLSAAQALDWLCLSLGLLSNLVQVVEETKRILRETMFDPQCIHKTFPCVRSCSCPNPTSILNTLVIIYGHQLANVLPHHHYHHPSSLVIKSERSDPSLYSNDQEAEADASFLLGHLSVLFGLLMMDNLENQQIVLDALPLTDVEPGSSEEDTKPNLVSMRRRRIAQLVENASELGVFYAVISRRPGLAGNGMGEAGAPFRDGNEDSDPGANGHVENDAARGADVAKGVITFLRDLGESL